MGGGWTGKRRMDCKHGGGEGGQWGSRDVCMCECVCVCGLSCMLNVLIPCYIVKS